MKKSFVIIMLIVGLCGSLLFSETLEEILAKNYESRGGLEKLKAVKSLEFKGKMIMNTQNVEMPMAVWFKKPNMMRINITFMGKDVVTAYDGKNAWRIMPLGGSDEPKELSEKETEQMSKEADSLLPLVGYKEKGYNLEYLGKEDMEGTEVYKLKMTKAEDSVYYFYLDIDSGIELKTIYYRKDGEKEIMVESLVGDYKEEDGIMFPFSQESKIGGTSTGAKVIYDSIKYNVEIDDSFFRMPAKKDSEKEKK